MKKIIIPFLIIAIIAFIPAPARTDTHHMAADNTEMPVQDNAAPSLDDDQDSSTQQDRDSTTPIIPQDEGHVPSPEASTAEDIPDDYEEEGTPVGQASSEGSNAARNQKWRNIALAVAAVAVAVTALLLVASNDGHHKKHHKHDK